MKSFTDLQREMLARHLRKNIAGEVRFDATSRRLYSTDASIYQMEPLGVVLPRTTADIVTTVQIAAETQVPLTARGGGTSLSGQSIGPGIVLDCSKYLNTILDVDSAARVARVQPGVVLDQLNRALLGQGLQFGPEVSTASRANLGGMIGNNSAGSRSIVYGKTIDHVRRLDVVLSDGSPATFGPVPVAEWQRRSEGKSLEASLYRATAAIVADEQKEIRRRFPRILRRVSGYNLDVLCAGLYPLAEQTTRPIGLHQLIVGSEGTLAVITEAELGLLPLPPARGLLVPQFATLAAALDALAACLEFQPSAVELLDHLLLELTAHNLSLREVTKLIQGRPEAVLMVEVSGEPGDVADRIAKLERRLRGVSGLVACVTALDPAQREPLWNLRRAAMPLLYGMPGDRKPVTFVEDAAVAPEHLPEFALRFREILRQHGTDGAYYGHASVGCLHIRPLLNLKDPTDVVHMRRIAAEVTELVLEYGGSLSGEHGDGFARSEWNPRLFGPAVYQAFCRIKEAFDPRGLLNPGRVVHAPPMTENLRYGPGYQPQSPATVFDYSRQEGFVRAVELCNGSGVCRKMQGGAMCPSFRATRDERDSTRGRANALRLALAEEAPLAAGNGKPAGALSQRWVHEVLDLCLMCKACKAECPSNVDMAKLKAEFLQGYHASRPRPLAHLLMAALPHLNRMAAPVAPLVNWLQRRPTLRWLGEKIAGIDRRRSMPPLNFHHFRRWYHRHRPDPEAGKLGRVLLLADCFTTYQEPAIGQAAVRVLERAGYTVELADVFCCGRVHISKGFLHRARALVEEQATALAQKVADGTPLLGLEPSCLLTLTDEWRELVPGPHTQAIASAAALADGWLAGRLQTGQCRLPLQPRRQMCLLHGHCHQQALTGVKPSAAALRQVPELEVKVLDAGCCGMAGSFGFEKEHYDLSVRIAGLALLPALAAQPEALVSATGTSCRHQIHDLSGRRALHPLEVLAEQMEASG